MLRRTRGVVQLAARWAPGIGKADGRRPRSFARPRSVRSPRRARRAHARRPRRRRAQGRAAGRRARPAPRTVRRRQAGAGPVAGVPLPQRQQRERSDRSRRSRRPRASRRASRARRRVARELLRSSIATGSVSIRPQYGARHPHLLHVAIADFGLSGPRAGWTAEPICAFAASGALYAAGFADSAALQAPGSPRARLRRRSTRWRGRSRRSPTGRGAASADGRGVGAGGRARRLEPVVDSARRLRAALSAVCRCSFSATATAPTRCSAPATGISACFPATPRHWRALRRVARQSPRRSPARSGNRRCTGSRTRTSIRLVAAESSPRAAARRPSSRAAGSDFPIVPCNTPEEFVAEAQTRSRGFFRATGFPHSRRRRSPRCRASSRARRCRCDGRRPRSPDSEAYLPPREPDVPRRVARSAAAARRRARRGTHVRRGRTGSLRSAAASSAPR